MRETPKSPQIIQGTAGSFGTAIGKVQIFKDISRIDSAHLEDEIIVAPYTTPKITPFLPKIKAIITEKGGITSHAAIIGREFGIPVVLGVKNATQLLRNGQCILVNGSDGEIEIFSKDSVQLAQWDITGACNLRCKHCRAWKLPKINELSLQEGINLLNQLYELEVQILNFSGGEPFLRRDLFQLLEHGKNFPLITITTNGTFLENEKYIKKLKGFNNIRISVSLDGIGKTHDNFRQVPGTFKKVIAAIANLTRESIRTSVRFTLTTLNEEEALKVYDLVSNYNIESFNIRAVLPLGRATSSMMPSAKLYRKTLEQLFTTSKKKKIPIISGDPILLPLYPQLLGKVYEEMGKRVYTDICAGCLAGVETLYIKPNGDVGACSYIPATVGNVRNQPLIQLINKTSLFKQLDNYRESLKGRCSQCQYKNICGGCRAAALALNGDLFAEDSRCLINS